MARSQETEKPGAWPAFAERFGLGDWWRSLASDEGSMRVEELREGDTIIVRAELPGVDQAGWKRLKFGRPGTSSMRKRTRLSNSARAAGPPAASRSSLRRC